VANIWPPEEVSFETASEKS